jgi:hypothetical protein
MGAMSAGLITSVTDSFEPLCAPIPAAKADLAYHDPHQQRENGGRISYFWSRNLIRGSVTFFGLFASALA